MFIIDLQQVMIANLMTQLGSHQNAKLDEDLLRHMILNGLRNIRKKFAADYGEMVIACDSSSWRRGAFPYYKANRRKSREASDMDWTTVFDTFAKVREELKAFFPYRVIHVDNAEADDVIGVLVHKFGVEFGNAEKIMIVSGDKDFKQLQCYNNVEQYDPTRKRMLSCTDADEFLREHIIRGDTSDGIPNILSKDDCLVTGTRQGIITQKRLDYFMTTPFEQLKDEEQRNWKRNELLISLNNIPSEIKDKIIQEYDSEAGKDRNQLFNYFIKHKLKFLMENISEF
jgi:hypothetical protein